MSAAMLRAIGLALLFAGCSPSAKVVATLEARTGAVDRDHASKIGIFTSARSDEPFFMGDGIRTGSQANASLRLAQGSLLTVEEKTLLRFLAYVPGDTAQGLDLEVGRAVLTTEDETLSVQTAFGDALIQPHGSLRLDRSPKGIRFEITLGTAVLDPRGRATSLKEGAPIEVGPDHAMMQLPARTDVPLSEAPGSGDASAARIGVAPNAEETHADTAGSVAATSHPDGAAAPDLLPTVDVGNDGVKIREGAHDDFSPLAHGTHVVPLGSTLDLGDRSHATLRTAKGSMRLAGPGRFVVGRDGEPAVRTESGRVDVASTTGVVAITVPGGTIHTHAQSRVSLDIKRTGTMVSVALGTVRVQGAKDTEDLGDREEAILDREGRIRRSRVRSLEHTDLDIEAGESLVIHDPHPPTALGIAILGQCEQLATVEITGPSTKSVFGEKTIGAALEAGKYSYAVRCASAQSSSDVVARGRVVILTDAGTRRLPTSAPTTRIDADGRNYTVLYQSRLPAVSIRWSKPPSAEPFTLEVRHAGGRSEIIATQGPAHTFASGKLSEGTHQFTFQAGTSRSKPTALEIRFDNATPTASIASPQDRSFSPGGHVLVAGTALAGMEVTAAGVRLTQDEQHRFSGQVVAPSSQRALAVRFAHPQHGTHVYLRRTAGSTP